MSPSSASRSRPTTARRSRRAWPSWTGRSSRSKGKKDPKAISLLPDVQIFHKAVHDALKYQEFFDAKDIPKAKHQLEEGRDRAESLLKGEAPWASQIGLVVRGYVSKIDGSVQPYGLVVPSTYTVRITPHRYRLDLWFQGRGETTGEVNFIDVREHNPAPSPRPTPSSCTRMAAIATPYKFAGEVDVPGGAGRRQEEVQGRRGSDQRPGVLDGRRGGLAVRRALLRPMVRRQPRARGSPRRPGSSRSSRMRTVEPTWYEKTLWHLYDCTDYAANLLQCPTVAYSGELDARSRPPT